jgi:hypothetical protein
MKPPYDLPPNKDLPVSVRELQLKQEALLTLTMTSETYVVALLLTLFWLSGGALSGEASLHV